MTGLVFFQWIGIATAGIMLLVAVTVLLAPIPLPNQDWLKGSLLVYLGILPVFVVLLGTGVSYERSKTVPFCASCHIMESRIHDLKDPQSDGLAATHYKNRYIREDQCFTCHTDYSLFGDAKAKLTGLRHVYAMTARKVKEPLKLYQPYNTTNCLHCHGESKKFLEAENHQDILQDLRNGSTSCLDCHGPAHNVVNSEASP